jgi:pimeloyl-ACP methyl ester carboxylesterase
MRHQWLCLVVLAVVAGPARVVAQTEREGDYVARDGVHMRYRVRGSGPPLVLLHGFALSGEINWVMPGAVDSLAREFTVIVPDLRGHGASDKPHDPASYGAHYVDDVVGMLDQLAIRRAHFAGYSMGGMILLKLVTTHPDRVRSAVLGGAGWGRPGGPPPPNVAGWIATLDRAAREHTSVAEALRPPGMPQLAPPVVALLDRNDAGALAAVLRSAAALAVAEAELRALRVPVHAVVGETDEGARGAVERLRRVRPEVTVTLIPGADHRQAMSDPALASAIRAFARGH